MEDAYLDINHSNQFISIRSKNVKDNPVLLFLHGGPGASATALFQRFNKDLEEDFTVVCWEQRGAGKSFSNGLDKATLTVPQMIDDAHVLISYLCQRFGKEKIFLLGHSWGSRLGMYLVKAYPEKIEGFIGVGQEVSAFEGELQSWQYTYQRALDTKNQQAIKELEEMGAPQNGSYLAMYKTGFWGIVKQKEWLLKLGGERYDRTNYNDWVSKMLAGYNGNVLQLVKWSKASATTAGTMFHDSAFNNFDLRTDIASVYVPVHFASGSSDYNTPWPLVKQYASILEAPEKSFTLFDKSGHSPLFEESDKFNAFVRRTFLRR
jgi:pimeloyl-ACP methyl ester carboxylesterase